METSPIDLTAIGKKLIPLVLAVFVGTAFGFVQNYRHSFRPIPVSVASGIQVNVYKYVSSDATKTGYKPSGTALFTLAMNQNVKLRNATTYEFVVSDPSHKYANPDTKITITKATNQIAITKPFYANSVLAGLLKSERPTIQSALLAAYPNLPSLYTVSNDQLYGYGNWYGAALTPLDPNNDSLRVVLGEQNGKWSVVSKPQVSIGEPSNPTIPQSVLSSIDRL